jgi:hypothetical protein
MKPRLTRATRLNAIDPRAEALAAALKRAMNRKRKSYWKVRNAWRKARGKLWMVEHEKDK